MWGSANFNGKHLYYNGEETVKAEPLGEFDILGKVGIGKVVYGSFFEEIQEDLGRPDKTFIFSYDWRASNVRSAENLDEFLCERISQSEPVIFIAHSMGGLVVKHWLRNHYDQGCNGQGQKLDIRRISFVATPHLGAPKSLLTFLYEEQLISFGPLNHFLAGSLNKYGPTFDSIYELFPFTHAHRGKFISSQLCLPPNLRERSPAFELRVGVQQSGNKTRPVDIFSASVLLKYGIERKFTDIGIINPQLYLQKKLDNARSVICDLLSYKFPEEIEAKFHFVAAKESHLVEFEDLKTVNQILISDRKIKNRTPVFKIDRETKSGHLFVYVSRTHGDETVPFDIAKNGTDDVRRFDMVPNASHLGILTSDVFTERLRTIRKASLIDYEIPYFWTTGTSSSLAWSDLPEYSKAVTMGLEITSGKPQQIFADLAVQNDDWNTSFLKVNQIANSGYGEIISHIEDADQTHALFSSRIAQLTIKGAIQTGDEAYIYAKNSKDISALDWQFISGLDGLSDINRAWAKNNGAYKYFAGGDYVPAVAGFDTVKHLAKNENLSLSISDPVLRQTIYNNAAWANIAAGNLLIAEEYFAQFLLVGGKKEKFQKGMAFIGQLKGFDLGELD